MKPRLLLCGGLPAKNSEEDSHEVTRLSAWGKHRNVHIRIEEVARVFLKQFSDRLLDLVEIASYVFSADCLATRNGSWALGRSAEPWSREFKYAIPVRDFGFWNDQQVVRSLSQVLNFVSDDKHDFRFEQSLSAQPAQSYLEFGDSDDWPFQGVDRVLMFSGGLDSLAGAVETAREGKPVVLVSHRAKAAMSKRQKQLVSELRRLLPQAQILHVPVWINKDKELGKEHTQRTRSFLFASIGAIVAHALGSQGVRFFENGIVSLNLPVADEVLRARASRTTHPYALAQLSDLMSLVFERRVEVDNPYLFETKTEVVQRIAASGAKGLIRYTCSCAHTGFFQAKTRWHCGTCSQCIDRRMATIASGFEDEDPDDDYVVNVFRGDRVDGYQKSMAVDYVRHATELARMNDEEILTKFNLEISRAVRSFPDDRKGVAQKLIDLHKRHGATIHNVLSTQLSSASAEILAGELPMNSMLMCVAGQVHLKSSWTRYAGRITDLLRRGVPVACASTKPKDEPHLQEICDGILIGNDEDLRREFPFSRWASSMTKPDWSNEHVGLWVEMKYVRVKRDIRAITEDIAADITKYGDNGHNSLFVIYDPHHRIRDDREIEVFITKHPGMMVDFIR